MVKNYEYEIELEPRSGVHIHCGCFHLRNTFKFSCVSNDFCYFIQRIIVLEYIIYTNKCISS